MMTTDYKTYLEIKINRVSLELDKPMSDNRMWELIEKSHRYQDALQEYEKYLSSKRDDIFNL